VNKLDAHTKSAKQWYFNRDQKCKNTVCFQIQTKKSYELLKISSFFLLATKSYIDHFYYHLHGLFETIEMGKSVSYGKSK